MGLRIKLLLVVIALCSVPPASAAKFYKWVDKNGRVTYQDRPPPSDAGYRVEEKRLGGAKAQDGGSAGAAEKFPVVLYSAPRCASCDAARGYLKARGVPFTEKNVDGDRKLQDELIKQAGGLSVPTITVGPKVMQGYLESLLEGELDQAGYPKPQYEEPEKPEEPEEPVSPAS